jgi:hypothetical protein
MKKKEQKANLLEMKPRHNVRWEKKEGDQIVLLLPKFTNKYLVRWILPRMKKPEFHIKLDERGSFVWELCDGSLSVMEIVDRLKERFPDDKNDLYHRTGRYIQQMVREKFLHLNSQQ